MAELENRIKPTFFEAGHAFNAFFFIDPGNFFLFPCNGFHRAAPETKPAFGALIPLDFKFQERHATFGRASFLINMGFIFVSEVTQGG